MGTPGGATRRFYGRWAALYDRLATLPVVDSWRDRAAAALACSPGDTVVEMGCGTGANVPHLRGRVAPGGRVVGLDLTRGMLDRASRRDAGAARDGDAVAVDFLQADATRPPVRRADAVLATFVVGMFADPAAAVDRWCDLTDGRVALLNFQRSDRALAAPLTLAFEAFVRLSAPGGRLARGSQGARFERRVRAARERLVERTVDRRFETFAGGFLGLLSGRVR